MGGAYKQDRIVLIIPTLNEKENIIALVETFLKQNNKLEILVADSDSPDKTAEIVKAHNWGQRHVWVLPCARQQGRGAAIAEAYRVLVQEEHIAIVGIADADFSHDPHDLPLLLTALQKADVVIGSRYVRGSQIKNWPIGRRVFSRAANVLARVLLRVGIKDYTNGYRFMTQYALKCLNLNALDADGFIMLSQELVQWQRQGLKITEVPTIFVNRRRGHSNFRLSLVSESLAVLFKLAVRIRAANRQ